jgi:hypothetical protein
MVIESPGVECVALLGASRLGVGSALAPPRARATRLDGSAVLGRARAVRATDTEDLPVASRRVEVLLRGVEPNDYDDVRAAVQRLFHEHAPATVSPRVRFASHEGGAIGRARVGIDFDLAAPVAARLGGVAVGRGVAAGSRRPDALGLARIDPERGPNLRSKPGE